MTDTLADDLPREIARVTAKKERWQGYMRDNDMGPGMQFSINIMQGVKILGYLLGKLAALLAGKS